jgi:hypothetical protein
MHALQILNQRLSLSVRWMHYTSFLCVVLLLGICRNT